MVSNGAGRWSRTLGRLFVSAFLVVHVSATLVSVMPLCPIRERCLGLFNVYILPLGLWQSWGMFAPDPVRDTVTLEAEVIDARGLRHGFAFPKLADYSRLRGVPRFRHSKFAANLSIPDLQLQREFAARHVVRQVGLPAEAFPLDVQLIYQVRPSPPPGAPPADPMTPTYPFLIGTFHFAGPREVNL